MNAIIAIEQGIIQKVITCKDDSQSTCIYISEARKMGVEISNEEEQEAYTNEVELFLLMDKINEDLEIAGKELKFIDTEHYS